MCWRIAAVLFIDHKKIKTKKKQKQSLRWCYHKYRFCTDGSLICGIFIVFSSLRICLNMLSSCTARCIHIVCSTHLFVVYIYFTVVRMRLKVLSSHKSSSWSLANAGPGHRLSTGQIQLAMLACFKKKEKKKKKDIRSCRWSNDFQPAWQDNSWPPIDSPESNGSPVTSA